MQDQFTGAFGAIERSFSSRIATASEPTDSAFLDLVRVMSQQTVSCNDALKMLEIYFKEYKRQKNVDALRYCTFEMERIVLAKNQAGMRSIYPRIDFEDAIAQPLLDFVGRKRPIYMALYRYFLNRWMVISTVSMILILLLFVLGFGWPFFFWFWLLLAIWLYLQWYARHKEVPYMIQRSMKRLYPSLDEAHRELISRWNLQSPHYIAPIITGFWNRKPSR